MAVDASSFLFYIVTWWLKARTVEWIDAAIARQHHSKHTSAAIYPDTTEDAMFSMQLVQGPTGQATSPNYHFYQTDCFPGRKGIPHNNVDLYYMCDTYTWQRPGLFIWDNPIFLSEKTLHKDYDWKGSVVQKKNPLIMSLKGLGVKTNWLVVNWQL
jgi:hypothetical protein